MTMMISSTTMKRLMIDRGVMVRAEDRGVDRRVLLTVVKNADGVLYIALMANASTTKM
jgi:hypothetical protein